MAGDIWSGVFFSFAMLSNATKIWSYPRCIMAGDGMGFLMSLYDEFHKICNYLLVPSAVPYPE
jgi:hypothetical protein